MGHGLMTKVQEEEKELARANKHVSELEAQLARMSKLEDLERSNQQLKEELNGLQARFEASERQMGEDISTLKLFSKHAETRALEAEVVRQMLEIDLVTKQLECNLKGQVLEQLQCSNKELQISHKELASRASCCSSAWRVSRSTTSSHRMKAQVADLKALV